MEASNKPLKYRIGPIKGMGSMRSEFHRAVAFFGAHLGFKVDSDDIKRAEATTDGIRLKLRSTGSATPGGDLWHNFQPYDITTTSCKIGAGTVTVPGSAAVYPCISGTAINAASPPSLTLHATSPNYLYVKVVMTPTTNSDSYVLGSTITSPVSSNCTIVASTSLQSSSGNTLYIPLSTITAGVVTSRTQYTNFSLRAYDDGTSTGVAIYEQW